MARRQSHGPRPRVVLQIRHRLRSSGTNAVQGRTHRGPLSHRRRPEVWTHVGWAEAEGGTGLRDLEGTLGAVLGRTHVPSRSGKY